MIFGLPENSHSILGLYGLYCLKIKIDLEKLDIYVDDSLDFI